MSLMVLPGGLSMCTCSTKSGPRGAKAVGEEHLRTWHVLNVHKCMCTFGKRIQGLKGIFFLQLAYIPFMDVDTWKQESCKPYEPRAIGTMSLMPCLECL